MNFLEAIERIEASATAVGISDVWGDPIEGSEAVAVIASRVGDAWSEIENRLERSEITAQDYCEAALELIDAFRLERFRKNVERKINNLKLDQEELDLCQRR